MLGTVLVGDGSAHTNPNHAFDVHLWCFVALGVVVLEGKTGGAVIGCDIVEVAVLSLHPQNKPGVSHFEVDVEGVVVFVVVVVVVVVVGSLHPPQNPGDWQEVVEIDKLLVEVGVKAPLVLVVVVLVLSWHPNQPGVLHVEVEDVVVVLILLVLVPDVVVVSSRQPHQPGVWHVAVLVLVFVEVDVEDVVVSELLLSKYFHSAQSVHSGVVAHSGTVSYFFITSSMTT